MPLPEPVRQVTAHYLKLAEERAPGLVEGFYLHGSLGFGEWYDGRSDVDFVAVTASRPEASTETVLQDLHEEHGRSFPRPHLSGLYVTWDDLARPPVDVTGLPGVLESRWSHDHGPDPVTWHELAHHSVHVHGPALDGVSVHTDVPALRRYSHANLASYWAPRLEGLELRHREQAAEPELVEWFVLGIPRLHHAIATGTLTSKDGAGHYALEVFDKQRWRPVVAEALAHRARGEATGRWAGREGELADEVLDFCRLALESGLALDPADENG